MEARTIGSSEAKVSKELKQLIAVAEQYPTLQANQSFLDLQRNLTEVEEHIQFARRYYNGAVRNLNILTETFPDSIIANFFQFRAAEFFEFESDPPDVNQTR